VRKHTQATREEGVLVDRPFCCSFFAPFTCRYNAFFPGAYCVPSTKMTMSKQKLDWVRRRFEHKKEKGAAIQWNRTLENDREELSCNPSWMSVSFHLASCHFNGDGHVHERPWEKAERTALAKGWEWISRNASTTGRETDDSVLQSWVRWSKSSSPSQDYKTHKEEW
jgi:hypothetical protein